jgi:very-short-patch-repair endonuclease
MGQGSRINRNRSKVVRKPKTLKQAVDDKTLRLKLRRRPRGDYIAMGSRIKKYSLTPDEWLMGDIEGSKPERLIYGWLIRHDIPFRYQSPLLGGRVPGGAIVDFIINLRAVPLIIRVMGYYHRDPLQAINDDLQRNALESIGWQVRDVWDFEVNTAEKVQDKMLEILYGMEEFTSVPGGPADRRTDCPSCEDSHCIKCNLPGV